MTRRASDGVRKPFHFILRLNAGLTVNLDAGRDIDEPRPDDGYDRLDGLMRQAAGETRAWKPAAEISCDVPVGLCARPAVFADCIRIEQKSIDGTGVRFRAFDNRIVGLQRFNNPSRTLFS